MPSHEFYTTPTLRLVVGPTASVDADVLVIPVFADTDPDDPRSSRRRGAGDGRVARHAGTERRTVRAALASARGMAAARVLLLGGGAAASASGRCRASPRDGRWPGHAHAGPGSGGDRGPWPAAGRSHRPGTRRGPDTRRLPRRRVQDEDRKLADLHSAAIVVSAGGADSLADAVALGSVLGEAVNVARAVAHEPPNVLTPAVLADRAKAAVCRHVRPGGRARRGAAAREAHGPAARRRAGQRARAAPDRADVRAGRGCWAGARRWSARPSRSTPAASRSSRPRTWTR